MEEDDGSDLSVPDPPQPAPKTNLEAKLLELLHKINSVEIKLVSDAAKEFTKLLKSEPSGGELLKLYARMSPNLSELSTAWKLREGKPGTSYILKLISVILNHPQGKYFSNDKERLAVSRVLDRFAKIIVEEKLEVVYKELGSKDAKRQNAALLLLASVVKRGPGFASEVEKSFNFKLPGFSALAVVDKKKKQKRSTRKAFVRFAMAFLEEGKPWLIRRVLKQREMFSMVLRGLGESHDQDDNEEDETVIHVLSTLRDRVLTEESKVPPGLRSVLFGSVTLERLIGISGRQGGGLATEVAHTVLVMVCTDPCNGLMPDLRRQPGPLKGNRKRLLGMMKKLRAAEVGKHRDLVLAIVKGRPEFGSAYLEEFPYNVEDYASPTWFGAISLASDVVSSVGKGDPWGFLTSLSGDPPSFDSAEVQGILKCISPRPLSRMVINKGLLHSDFLVKNGTLKFHLEALKLLESFLRAINLICSKKEGVERLEFLKQEFYNEMRTLLPDPQVLLTLLSSLTSRISSDESHSKRKAEEENFLQHGIRRTKKLKANVDSDDTDIIVAGIGSSPDVSATINNEHDLNMQVPDEKNAGKDFVDFISDLWGSDLYSEPVKTLKDVEIFFLSKLLDSLKIYVLTMPTAMEGSFDFFMNHLSNGSVLPAYYQISLFSLLVEYIRWCPRSGNPITTPPMMYKHLQLFLNLLIFSPVDKIKVQAYNLAQAAMSSTGAFDRNMHEVVAWLSFLPGFTAINSCVDLKQIDMLRSLSPVVISFLCDAISTVGNNLFRYWDVLRNHTSQSQESKDKLPNFSPLVICGLQKCIRLLNSASRTFSLPEKSMISIYVCNTLKYLLQTQVDAGLLSVLIKSVVSRALQNIVEDSANSFCEWRQLKNLLSFAEGILHQKSSCIFPIDQKALALDDSLTRTLYEVRKILKCKHDSEVPEIRNAFASTIMCSSLEGLLKSFPSVMTMAQYLRVPTSFLSSIIFLEQGFLSDVLKLWPNMFWSGMEMAVSWVDLQCTVNEESALDMDHDDSSSAAAAAFSLVLRQTPFHLLLPAIISISLSSLSDFSKMKDVLLAKLSSCMTDCAVSHLRLLLFWFHQLQSCIRIRPLAVLEQLAEICLILVKHILAQQFVVKSDAECLQDAAASFSAESGLEVAENVLCHPSMAKTLTYPLSQNDEEFVKEHVEDDLETFISFSALRVHKLDHYVLNILKTTCHYLSSSSSEQHFLLRYGAEKLLLKAFNTLAQKLCLELKEKFDLCIRTGDLFPVLQPFHALHELAQFLSPFQLLEIGQWIFRRLNVNGLTDHKSCKISALSVGFCVVKDAFRCFFAYSQQCKNGLFCGLWEVEEKSFDISIIEEMYLQVCKFATDFNLDGAYDCLLNVVSTVYEYKYRQYGRSHPINLVLFRVVMSTPIQILRCCIYRTSKAKAKLLFLLVEMSSLHLSIAGHMLVGILNGSSYVRVKVGEDVCWSPLSDDDFILLLPSALSYLNLMLVKLNKQHNNGCASIPSFYSKLLINGFCNWKSFVTGHVFCESYDEFSPSTIEEFVYLMDSSLLGKAIQMLQCHFALSSNMKMKERLKLCSSVLSCSTFNDELLDYDGGNMELCSLSHSKNHIARVVAKIKFCRMLLFPEGNKTVLRVKKLEEYLKEISSEKISDKEYQARMQFLKDLVGSWQCIIKKCPLVLDGSTELQASNCLRMYRHLELFILQTLVELITEMRESLILLQSVPFLEQLMRFSLLYRFEDPATLRIIRMILTLLSEGKFSCRPYLQLLLAHSQFAPTMYSVPESLSFHNGAVYGSTSSILRSLAFPHSKKKNLEPHELYLKRLEIVKLLRVLLHLRPNQSDDNPEDEFGVNLRELHLLLLSSYGASTSEIDLEIFNIMCEIESNDKLIFEEVAAVDYLWGSAALTIRKEKALSKDTSDIMTAKEAFNEHWKSLFRDNLPVDPNVCVSTVLHYPYSRTSSNGDFSLNKITLVDPVDIHESNAPSDGNIQQYDPLFLLRFSIHALSRGYIEPVEFSALGLLAVAFISISSPDIGIRKLGYEFIGKYKNSLEKSQKRKDIMQLRLLLTHIQNGIEDPWQKIPSIIALFAAESSVILADPSHDHYAIISKHLMHSSRVNMKCIPLFDTLFLSSSVNFRAERLWMLRLACAGLNLDDDAQIFIWSSTMRTLLSFYTSSLSDRESKEIILQIVKKSVKLRKMARHVVEQCGLFPWVSSVVSTYVAMLNDNEKSCYLHQLIALMEVVMDVISSRNIIEWLQNYALEQLIDLMSHLYKLLVCEMDLLKENFRLVNLILRVMISTLKVSQKRKIYQPHFTLSFEGLFRIYQAIDLCGGATSTIMEFGLRAILMSTPPVDIFHTDKEKLLNFLTWAASTALKSDSEKLHHHKEPSGCGRIIMDDAPCEESLVSKLLRWLVASVFLAKLSLKLGKFSDKLSKGLCSETMLSFLEFVEGERGENNRDEVDLEEVVAAFILHLQQLLGMNFSELPSVVSVLCFLLLCDASKHSEGILDYRRHIVSLGSKVRFPAEANPAWRWSFYQPWKDLTSELSDSQKMAEHHTCQLLILISTNVLRKRSLNSQLLLTHEDIERSGVYEWEQSIIDDEAIRTH